MSLPRTLLKRGIAIFATVAVTLLLICIVAGASGMEERILRGKMIYLNRGYGMTLHGLVEAGEIEVEDVPRLLEEHRPTPRHRLRLCFNLCLPPLRLGDPICGSRHEDPILSPLLNY
ncbi:MAG: hypothetical protein NWE88_03120 [Candidatus Bathyarchaeota archaeon]|nr:hypothetical protein [Candidatus Bathyarchaeota archaeon]